MLESPEKVRKRYQKVTTTILNMHSLFAQKIAKLLELEIVAKVFEACPLYQKMIEINYSVNDLDNGKTDEIMLKGFFLIYVVNDPVIRQYVEIQSA